MSATTDRARFRELVAEVAAKAKVKLPECNGRVEGAVRLVLAGDVALEDGGTARVGSASSGARLYRVVSGHCDCHDWSRAPHGLCKHRLAVCIQRRVGEMVAAAAPVVPDVLPPCADVPGVLTPSDAAVEARSSCTVRLFVHGHEVVWTLRDSEEGRLAARLERLLAQYPDR